MNLDISIQRAAREGLPEILQDAIPVGAQEIAAAAASLPAVLTKLRDLEDEGRVGFARLDRSSWGLDEAARIAASLHDRADVLLLLGIGGSALGARMLAQALASPEAAASLVVLDTVDPIAVQRTLARLDPARTAIAVVSKSGGTLETAALFRVFLPWLQAATPDSWRERLVLVTDPVGGQLRPLAVAEGLSVLPIPPDVGGRFSVLSAVGILPACWLGIDVEALLAGADAMIERCAGGGSDPSRNPAAAWAVAHDAWWGHASVSVLFTYCDRLASLGAWYGQLWAESLGKPLPGGGRYGWTPSIAQGPVDQHSQLQLYQEGPADKLYAFLGVDDHGADLILGELGGPAAALAPYLPGKSLAELMQAEQRGTMAALLSVGRPLIELRLPRVDAHGLGELILMFELATAYAGLLRGLDPFDQPGVEAGKRYGSGLLGRAGYEAEADEARALIQGEAGS